jgi:hypothetical protein
MSVPINFEVKQYSGAIYNSSNMDLNVMTSSGAFSGFDDGSASTGPVNAPPGQSGVLNWRLDVLTNDAFNPSGSMPNGCYPSGTQPSSIPQFCVQYFTTFTGRWRRLGTFNAGSVGVNTYSATPALWSSWVQTETF